MVRIQKMVTLQKKRRLHLPRLFLGCPKGFSMMKTNFYAQNLSDMKFCSLFDKCHSKLIQMTVHGSVFVLLNFLPHASNNSCEQELY